LSNRQYLPLEGASKDMDLEGIKARADAARAPYIAYWLIVFTYLMIHLFPVAHPSRELSYSNNGSVAVLTMADDWVPPSGTGETPIMPHATALRPLGAFSVLIEREFPFPLRTASVAFNSRDPPAVGC
jgi:hypothetical protein